MSNLERAWGLTGGSADKLTGMMVQISQVVIVRRVRLAIKLRQLSRNG